jgi:hypothetical protein
MDPIERERDLNHWLESALWHSSKAEPRPGLENRVLASLQAERYRTASRRRWGWAVGTATAGAAFVVAVWIGPSARERGPASTAGRSTTHSEASRGSFQAQPTAEAVPSPANRHAPKEFAKRKSANRPMRDGVAESAPKLAQFPSPQPLSEQEQILASYVARYPDSAALVAEARAAALQQDLEEEAAAAAAKTR